MVGRVTRDVARDHARDAAYDDVALDVVGAEGVGQISAALACLDEKYRDVLTLFAGPGLSYDEISRALQIPIGTVRSRMSRGRLQLRELLDPSGQYRDMDESDGKPIEEERIP
jgi:RNA polymerase sigma-70 factor (ECF subfamily)